MIHRLKLSATPILLRTVTYTALIYFGILIFFSFFLVSLSISETVIGAMYGCSLAEGGGPMIGLFCHNQPGEMYKGIELFSTGINFILAIAGAFVWIGMMNPIAFSIVILLSFIFEKARLEKIKLQKLS